MKERSLKFLAKIFANRWLLRQLACHCKVYEKGHLYDVEGNVYMWRYEVVARGSKLSKVLSFLTRGEYEHVRLHGIMQPDRDRDLHNHPFNYRTFIVDGWYREQRFVDASRTRVESFVRTAGETIDGAGFHRISQVSKGGVWTLFFMGKDHGKWGFWCGNRYIESRDYFNMRS